MTRNNSVSAQIDFEHLVGQKHIHNGIVFPIEHITSYCFGGENDHFPAIQFQLPGDDLFTSIRADSVKIYTGF